MEMGRIVWIDKDSAVEKSKNDWHGKMIVQSLHLVKALLKNIGTVL
jgi:hypothetical protein